MKYIKIFVALLFFTFVFGSCTNEPENSMLVNDEFTEDKLELRMQQYPSNTVVDPDCGPLDWGTDLLYQNDGRRDTLLITMANGCTFEVSMDIQTWNSNTSQEVIKVFSDLHWRLAYPTSSYCEQYYIGLLFHSAGNANSALDNFIFEIQEKFQDIWMSNFVKVNLLKCRFTGHYARSLYFKAVCQQRCGSSPGLKNGPVIIIDKPCAVDGCCVRIGYYCVDANGQDVHKDVVTELLSPCSQFFEAECGSLIKWGDCRDLGCND